MGAKGAKVGAKGAKVGAKGAKVWGVHSRGALKLIFRRPYGLNPREFTRACALELYFLMV